MSSCYDDDENGIESESLTIVVALYFTCIDDFESIESSLTVILQDQDEFQDYFPFPNKAFALLYLLINAPWPMVIIK